MRFEMPACMIVYRIERRGINIFTYFFRKASIFPEKIDRFRKLIDVCGHLYKLNKPFLSFLSFPFLSFLKNDGLQQHHLSY